MRRIFNPIAHHPAFHDLVFNPKIVDVVENLLGPDIQLHHTKLNLKPPSKDARFEWHQDYPFFPHTNFDLLAVMIMLDDSTEENGCLKIIPGSHKWGPRNHLFAKDGAFSSQLEDKRVLEDPSRWQTVPVPAGGMELHHCNMLHSSGPTAAPIRAAPSSSSTAPPTTSSSTATAATFGNGMQIRGTNPYRVRMIEMVAAEMRSQGIILLGAQQQASLVSTRVFENSGIKALGPKKVDGDEPRHLEVPRRVGSA